MVVAPGMAGRHALIKKAAYTINGRAAELEPEANVQEAALPVFTVAPEAVVIEEAVVEVAPEAPVVADPVTIETVVSVSEPAPIVAAPKGADIAAMTPAPLPLLEVAAKVAAAPVQDTSVGNAGAPAAIMAARLPFLIVSSF